MPIFVEGNLDSYGVERLEDAAWRPGWCELTQTVKERCRNRFYPLSPHRLPRDKEPTPFVYIDRLIDWRRMERVYNRTMQDYSKAWSTYWEFATELFRQTVKVCGRKVEAYYIQDVNKPPHKGKKTKEYDLLKISRDRDRDYTKKLRICESSFMERDEANPHDASVAWIWLGTAEELEFNRLRKRADQCRRRNDVAARCFNEAIVYRLADWRKKKLGDESGWSHIDRKLFVAIETSGRSYGFLVGCNGFAEPVWSPPEKPLLLR